MRTIQVKTRELLQDKSGNIAISSALTAPLLIFALALGVDYGYLTMQQRALQQTADLAAIAGASNIAKAEAAVFQHLQLNGQKMAVKTDKGMLTPDGEIPFDEDIALTAYNGYATVVKGRYVPDPAIAVGERFESGATPYNALKVNMQEGGRIYFAGAFTSAPRLAATGTAASEQVAAFSVGSRLLSLDGGLLNSVLGGLLGTTVSLKVMDYESLLNANVNALKFIDALALDLGLQAGTYEDVLKTSITYPQLLTALSKTTGLTPAVSGIIRGLEKTVNKTNVTLKLEQVLSLAPFSQRLLGTGENLSVTTSVFDLISAAAVAANGGKQIALNIGASVPGLASTKVELAIGEPPVGTPYLAAGTIGSVVRTAQTRLAVEVTVDGLAAIAGLKVRVPLYVEVAHAEARLANVRCYGGASGNASVDIEAVPGVAEIALGNVNKSAFANFGSEPRVTKAAIIDSALLSVSGMAHVNATNLTKKTLTFSPSDIAFGNIRSVSTKDTATSLVQSLLKNLNLEIKVLFLSLGTPTLIQAALADTLSLVTKPLDTVLYNTLLVLGIRIGEADVRVTGVSCQRPVLVQ